MKVKKAVITAAGIKQRSLPLQSVIASDGTSCSALVILVSELVDAGINDIAVIVHPGDETRYAEAVDSLDSHIHFIPQQPAGSGYGHAIQCAAEFTGDDPFLLTVSDHLYTSGSDKSCVAQLLAAAEREKCAVSAVEATHESQLPYYGCIGGTRIQSSQHLYEVTTVIEKPTPTEAEQSLVVPGLRHGNYLAYFGLHVLTPSIMQILKERHTSDTPDLSSALQIAAQQERYLACEINGRRHDIGLRYGILRAQLALALSGKDRDQVLNLIIEQLAQTKA